jgi:tripartite-type tricarboxylate transporter receptor subunit TctC
MIRKLFLQFALLLLSSSAFANINVIVPFSAGGAIDKIAREFSAFVKIKTGQDIFVENKVGAGSVIGTTALVSAGRSDSTIMITSSSFFNNIADSKFKKEEFTLISVLGINPYVLVAPSLKNLSCEDIKNKNRQFFVGSAGKGSASDSAAEILISKYQNFTLVPYKGISQVLTDLIPGRLDFTFTSGLKNREDLKVLATTTTSEFYKGIPNWKSCLGIDVNYYGEYLIVSQSSASADFVKKINNLAVEFVKQQDVIEQFKQDGIQPLSYNLKEVNDYYSTSLSNWKKILKKN